MGNLPADITEDEFKRLFAKYGEPGEVFINKGKGFGFIKLVSVFGCFFINIYVIKNVWVSFFSFAKSCKFDFKLLPSFKLPSYWEEVTGLEIFRHRYRSV